MKAYLTIITLLISLTYLVSCDCNQNVSGTIIDKATGHALKDAIVYKKEDKAHTRTLTDSAGYFELSDITGGLGGCPPMKIVAELKGFQQKEITIPSGGQATLELEKN